MASSTMMPTTMIQPKQRPSPILQSKPKYQLHKLGPAALVSPDNAHRDDDDHSHSHSRSHPPESSLSSSDGIPDLYTEMIIKGFGSTADLYRDVLRVSPEATPRDTRIAYFRRGREVLAERGVRGLDLDLHLDSKAVEANHHETDGVSHNTTNAVRIRFQAVSMAYEIVSTPAWKQHYLARGLMLRRNSNVRSVDSNDPVKSSAASASMTPSSSNTTTIKPAVRWNEHVEELVFAREPEEAVDGSKKLKKKKKKKAKIVVESAQLDEHLKKLDDEAEQHFVTDFWDSLEESLDGLLKLAVDKEKKQATNKPSSPAGPPKLTVPYSYDSGASVPSSVATDDTPFDESDDDMLDNVADQLLLGKQVTTLKTGRTNKEALLTSSDHTATTDSVTTPSIASSTNSRSIKVPTSPFRPISPQSESQQQTSSNETGQGPSVDEEGAHMLDVESDSFSRGQNDPFHPADINGAGGDHEATSRQQQQQQEHEQINIPSKPSKEDDDDIFYGLEDEAAPPIISLPLRNFRSDSPTAASTMSDLSESVVAPFVHSARQRQLSGTPNTLNRVDEGPKDEFGLDGILSVASSRRSHITEGEEKCDTLCGDAEAFIESFSFLSNTLSSRNVETTTTTATTNVETKEELLDDEDDDGFYDYIVAYIQAIVNECAITDLVAVDWKESILDAFIVGDDNVEQVMHIVQQEIQRAPTLDAIDAVQQPAVEAARSFG